MMKKLLLPIIWVCGFAGVISAQEFTNTRILNQAAIGYRISGNANYAKALALAKRNGWELTISSRGRKGVLVGVDDFGFPKYYMTNNNTIAAATTRANQLWPGGSSGLNLSGSSANMKNKLGIWDGGAVLATHVELTGRVTQKDNPASTSDHSTHVTGTMIASGVNPSAKGMAYGLQGMVAYDFTSDITEIASEAPNLLLSNHSYSIVSGWSYNSSQSRWEFMGNPNDTEDYKFGYYSDDSQALDSIAYNAPFYLIVKSAGNSRNENGPAVGQPYFRRNASGQMADAGTRPAGISSNDSYDIISWDCGAKNILTVGAVSGIASGYSRKEDVVMSAFSSWGPTDDGRIKPDVVADGVNLLSPINTTNTSYATYSGTSMAAPNATGSLLLLQEYYSKLKGTTSFLRSATLKGLAIHTADEAGLTPGPDYQFGWGLLNVQKAADVITAAIPSNNASTSQHLIYENTLTQGQTFTTNVIASGKGPLTATICWTDVKGAVDKINVLNNRTKNLVNDLDIRITKGSGSSLTTYYPWTLNVNSPSLAAVPGDNITDNVEKIDMDSTVPGQTYTITVTHKGTLAKGSQAYSLLVSGVGGTAYCASASGGGGARIDSVSFKTIHVGNSAGSKTYTDNTKYVADIEASQTIPISIKVGTAGATTNSRIVKVFIDFNNNGVFDASELVATSSALSAAAQFYNTNITTPSGLAVGNIYLMRIIVQETAIASDVLACGTYGQGETQDYRVRVVNPSNDVMISEIVSPSASDCGSGAQYLTVKIKNTGSVDQSNIPLTATISSGATAVANFSFTYPGPIIAQSEVAYTFQSPFATTGGTTYTITAGTNLSTDQNPSNNSLVSTFNTLSKPAAVSAVGNICGTSNVTLKVNTPDLSNYFWYSTPTTNLPFNLGATVNTTTIPGDKTYYAAKEAKTGIGPANKTVFPSGGYNVYGGNYVKINNTVPIVIETARLYIAYPGQVKFTLANIITEDVTQGTYSYSPLYSTILDVYATRPNPTPVSSPSGLPGNLASDTGAIYYLNIPVTTTGDHVLIIECLKSQGRSDSAAIFRNNGIIGTTTYPMAVPNIMSITGNSAHTGTAQESQYYYFFYDMKINTGACVSDRVAVVATNSPTPVITQQADSLVSSIATGNLWYLNDTIIINANKQSYKPTKSGIYKSVVTDVFGCQQTSNAITFAVTAIADVLAREIKLNVSPNPNNGVFNLSFEVTTKADLSIDILSASGQRVYNSSYPNFTGKFSKQIRVDGISSEFYILTIRHNKKTYVQKLLIQR